MPDTPSRWSLDLFIRSAVCYIAVPMMWVAVAVWAVAVHSLAGQRATPPLLMFAYCAVLASTAMGLHMRPRLPWAYWLRLSRNRRAIAEPTPTRPLPAVTSWQYPPTTYQTPRPRGPAVDVTRVLTKDQQAKLQAMLRERGAVAVAEDAPVEGVGADGGVVERVEFGTMLDRWRREDEGDDPSGLRIDH